MVDGKTAAHECVSDEALSHFKQYKYSSVDKSYISYYILRHYWNASVRLLPLWMHPNLVTLTGFMFILGNIALLQIYDPALDGSAPSWVYYSFAGGLWMYSTMDNIDGKQARRTGTSSGLGELFDHGIDSLNCTLGSLLETAAMGLGPTRLGAFTAIIPTLPMFFSTWETYHSHTLFLGYFNGPTEGLILACTFMLLSAHFGPGIWSSSLSSIIPLPSFLQPYGTLSVIDLWPYFLLFTLFAAHIPDCVNNVATARRARGLAVLPTLLEWTPMAIYTLATCAWVGSPHSIVLKENWLVLWCITQSFVFGRMTTKIILAHLTRQGFPYWTVLISPLVGGAVMFYVLPEMGIMTFSPLFERVYLWAYFVFAVVVYFRWAFLVVGSICDYLGISCLTIPAEKQRENEEKARQGKLQ